jgi:alanyl-tRNA synthetase
MRMRPLLLLSLALLLGACATKPTRRPAAPPSTASVKSAVVTVRRAVAASGASVAAATAATGRATVKAAELHRVAPPDLRPLVESLQAELVQVNENLWSAKASETKAVEALGQSEQAADALQARIALQTQSLETALIAEERATAKAKQAQTDADRWRKMVMNWRAAFAAAVTATLGLLALKLFGLRAALIVWAVGGVGAIGLKLASLL